MTTHHSDTTDRSRLVVIKRYTIPSEAWMDAELLRSHGIECTVDGAIGGSVLPFIPGQVSLVVAAVDAGVAIRLVPGAEWPDDTQQ